MAKTSSFQIIEETARSNRNLTASDAVSAGVPACSVRAMLHHLVVRGSLVQVERGIYKAAR